MSTAPPPDSSRAAPQTERSRLARAGWLIVGIAVVVLKAVVLSDISHLGRVAASLVLAAGAAASFWRGRIVTTCFLLALVVPIAAGIHPFGRAALIAVGLLVVLTALSFLTGLVLRARDGRDPNFRSGGSSDGDPQAQPVDANRIGIG